MTRPFIICAAVVVAAVLIFAALDRAGVIGKDTSVASIPTGLVPHGGAEKPVSDQVEGNAR